MSRKRTKQYLMLLMVIGLVSIAAGGSGTFASFSAEVANTGNTFATGTLYLHETATGTCTSESASSNSNLGTNDGATHIGDACDVLFSGVHSSVTVGLDMKNAGSLDASGLSIALNHGCTSAGAYETISSLNNTFSVSDPVTVLNLQAPLDVSIYDGATVHVVNGSNQSQDFVADGIAHVGDTSIDVVDTTASQAFAPGNNVQYAPTFSGATSSDLCDNLKMSIVEVPTSGDLNSVTVDGTTGDTTAPANSVCVYGTTDGNNGCLGSSATALSAISAYGTPPYDDLSLKSDVITNPNSDTGLDSTKHRYLVVTLFVDPAADNAAQGEQAAFDLVWHMDQLVS